MNDRNDDEAIGGWKADEFWRRIAGGFERFDDETIPFLVRTSECSSGSTWTAMTSVVRREASSSPWRVIWL